jgi:monothiol glutaredoxin
MSTSSMPITESDRREFAERVRANPVVLFMKGNRRFPACGFSATVVGILEKLGAAYETVNILEDPRVREGMKEYSSWPTFPQLYVKGEFVGGCDIVKEMYASGELQKVLGAEPKTETAGVGKPTGAPRITISSPAARALSEAAPEGDDEVLRLEIDPDFNPDLHIAPKREDDLEVTSSGVRLYVGRASAARAEGIAIDYVQAPGGMAFKIDNPNRPAYVKGIGPKELKAMLDAGKVHLFDVRPGAERALASIAQAKSLEGDGERVLFGLPKDAAIALHCHHGMRSRAAGERLLSEGFTNVYNLEGGIEAWSRDVDPTVPRY